MHITKILCFLLAKLKQNPTLSHCLNASRVFLLMSVPAEVYVSQGKGPPSSSPRKASHSTFSAEERPEAPLLHLGIDLDID